jgi:hypothetical protein
MLSNAAMESLLRHFFDRLEVFLAQFEPVHRNGSQELDPEALCVE